MSKYHIALLVAALAMGSLTYYIKVQPFTPCEEGHCPNENRPEYLHAAKFAQQKTLVAQREAPFWGMGAFAATVLAGIAWPLIMRRRSIAD